MPTSAVDHTRNGFVARTPEGEVVMNTPALTFLRNVHGQFRRSVEEPAA